MMNSRPIFQYHISGLAELLTEDSPLWHLSISGTASGGILIHEYFEWAQKFIQANNYNVLQEGIRFILNKDCPIEALDQVDIYLEKHGAFYHPARVEVSIKGHSPLLFVLNTAISPYGLALINNEYRIMKYLNELDDKHYLPRVFGVKTMSCRGMQISFFLATWFDGYKEFHLTKNPDKAEIYNLHLWNGDGSVSTLSHPAYFEIYDKASEILTHFYNIKTFEHISPWHHAAGDFITKPTEQGLDVKLITARGYDTIVESVVSPETCHDNGHALMGTTKNESLMSADISKDFHIKDKNYGENEKNAYNQENCNDSGYYRIEDTYKALLLFFLKLTLRMRIDRLDGTGDYCMVDADSIPFILNGFFRALENKEITTTKKSSEKPFFEKLKASFSDAFKSYLMQFSHDNLHTIFLVMTEELHPDNPETSFILKNLRSHSETLFKDIHNHISSVS
ncbi:MAG: hypothetical protein HQK62_02740 [Desulfamplus sp.]|nr:hypothetical protein [Desulfamplus sp.]